MTLIRLSVIGLFPTQKSSKPLVPHYAIEVAPHWQYIQELVMLYGARSNFCVLVWQNMNLGSPVCVFGGRRRLGAPSWAIDGSSVRLALSTHDTPTLFDSIVRPGIEIVVNESINSGS